jgi:hypothetical protein
MKQFFTLLLACILATGLTQCSKSSRPDSAEPEWLAAKKAEHSSCVCLQGIRTGIYRNEVIYELYIYDPLCSGVNVVYKEDGSIWFISGDAEYENYRPHIGSMKVIWTCEKR